VSRRALELLRAGGVEPHVRRFLEEPPTPDELASVLAALGVEPHALARRDADEYQALRLSGKTPASELVAALCRHPAILERPIVVAGGRAVIARPPERVEELLGAAGARRPEPP
jgi:arsenate reductase